MDLLSIYYRMPYPIRCLAASIRGAYLNSWRYCHKTDQLVADALERETWSVERLQEWQNEQLSQLLYHAATHVPYYRDYWSRKRRKGDISSIEHLGNWPVVTKDDLRSFPRSFLSEGCDPKRMYHEHTSGTTGKPLTLWMSKDAVCNWYALFEARWRTWYGLSRNQRWAILGGQLIVPYAQQHPPYWVWNASMRQLYMSSYHLSIGSAERYVSELKKYQVIYILGYASSLFSLAKFIKANNLPVPSLKAIISNAEPLYDFQRQVISEVFQCPVINTYGMSENVCAASECEHGLMHLWPEAGVLEILNDDEDTPVAPGQTGRMVCTGLLNPTMPLIRYEVGDRGSVAQPGTQCECGRSLPILSSIEGRNDDVILTMDGRRVGRLDPVFKSDLPIREAQIIQERIDLFRILIVPDFGYTTEAGESIAARLCDRVGQVRVLVEVVNNIPRTKNGKFRAVVSLLRDAVIEA